MRLGSDLTSALMQVGGGGGMTGGEGGGSPAGGRVESPSPGREKVWPGLCPPILLSRLMHHSHIPPHP